MMIQMYTESVQAEDRGREGRVGRPARELTSATQESAAPLLRQQDGFPSAFFCFLAFYFLLFY